MTTNAATIERWLRIFHPAASEAVELRALHVQGRKAVCQVFTDMEKMATFAVEMDQAGAKGCYFTPNPLRPELAGASVSARKADVLRRHWLLIDADSVRETGTNSTEQEREAAWRVIDRARTMLDTAGFVGAVIGDSGNGWHLCYPIDLPADDGSQATVKAVLKGLAERCNDQQAIIDTSTHDAPRIWKLYGTMARKGQSLEGRPQRCAQLIEGEPWSLPNATSNNAALPRLLATWQQIADWRRGRPLEATAADRARAYLATMDPTQCGTASCHTKTYHAAALLTKDFALSVPEAAPLLAEWCRRGTHQWSEPELLHKLWDAAKSAGDVGKLLSAVGTNGHGSTFTLPLEPDPPADTPLIVRASEITPRRVEWLWPSTVPLGKLVTFAGVGGLGKSFCLLDLAARVSRGMELPFCGGECAPLGQTLFISGEDDPEDTLVPRLIEMGADLSKVSFLSPRARDRFDLAALKLLTAVLDQIGPDCRLVVIDPPSSFLTEGIDDHKNSDLRRLLTPLQSWAAEKRVSLIFNTHLNKAVGSKDAMMRVTGSVAWVNAVRAAHLFARDPEDPERRFFVPMKMNLAPERSGLAYRIVASGGLAKVQWLGEIDVTANDAAAGVSGEKLTPREEAAVEWLVEMFREQREWESEALFERGKVEGKSRSAIFAAKTVLKLPRARKLVGGKWVWWVPENWQPNPLPPQNDEPVEPV